MNKDLVRAQEYGDIHDVSLVGESVGLLTYLTAPDVIDAVPPDVKAEPCGPPGAS